MEGAGKLIDDDELREAMQEKGLGTPATRAAIIEGLINREVHAARRPRADPHGQGLPAHDAAARPGVEELSKPELTGEWEYKLAQMEHGQLSRDEPSCARSPP
jgi:DNA topoisomerase-3